MLKKLHVGLYFVTSTVKNLNPFSSFMIKLLSEDNYFKKSYIGKSNFMEMQLISLFFLQYLDELRKWLLFDQLNLVLFVTTVKNRRLSGNVKVSKKYEYFQSVLVFIFLFYSSLGHIEKIFHLQRTVHGFFQINWKLTAAYKFVVPPTLADGSVNSALSVRSSVAPFS